MSFEGVVELLVTYPEECSIHILKQLIFYCAYDAKAHEASASAESSRSGLQNLDSLSMRKTLINTVVSYQNESFSSK